MFRAFMVLGIGLWVLIIVVALFVLWIIFTFNSFVRLKNRAENAWSQIDVQLKRRFDLIPNLVEAVKGYMKHEKDTLKEVTAARTEYLKATGPAAKAKAENQLSGTLKTIFAVAESYPKLQASDNFMQLQEELSGTESKIAYARQFYNDSVQEWNVKLETFPSNILAKIFSYAQKEFFKTEGVEREAVKVKF